MSDPGNIKNDIPPHKVRKNAASFLAGHRMLKRGLLSAIGLMLVFLIAVFIGYRSGDTPTTITGPDIQDDANMALNEIRQTATKNGRIEWDLTASHVRYMDDSQRALFEKVFITLFPKNQATVHVHADEGLLQPDSRDMEVRGNVKVENDAYRLETERLDYRHEQQIMIADLPVTITGDGIRLTANRMKVDLESKSAELEGDVLGIFHVTLPL